jgi:hypothetical protein
VAVLSCCHRAFRCHPSLRTCTVLRLHLARPSVLHLDIVDVPKSMPIFWEVGCPVFFWEVGCPAYLPKYLLGSSLSGLFLLIALFHMREGGLLSANPRCLDQRRATFGWTSHWRRVCAVLAVQYYNRAYNFGWGLFIRCTSQPCRTRLCNADHFHLFFCEVSCTHQSEDGYTSRSARLPTPGN